MSLAEIKRLHALVLAGKNAATERDDKIRALAKADWCPRCVESSNWDAFDNDPLIPDPDCPDCGGSGSPPSYAVIARWLDLSRERIRQIADKA